MSEAKEAYRKFCTEEKDLPIYFQPWYLDAVSEDGIWEVALVEKGGTIIAALPYFLKRKLGFQYITMPGFVKMLGPYLQPSYRRLKDAHLIATELIDQLPKVDGFRQQLHYSFETWLPFYWKGFQQTTRYTYLLDLQDLEEVYRNINRNMRRNIKKAQGIVEVDSEGTLEEFYTLNKMSFDRQGLALPYSFAQLQKHDAALEKHQARQLFFARDEQGQLHSAACLIWDNCSSYYHLCGDNPELRQSGAGILLIWEAIQFTKKQLGLNTFDFEGSMIEPIEKIRQQFGARQQAYSFVWKYYSPWYKLLKQLRGN